MIEEAVAGPDPRPTSLPSRRPAHPTSPARCASPNNRLYIRLYSLLYSLLYKSLYTHLHNSAYIHVYRVRYKSQYAY